jgi:hypothetical protein
MSEPHLYAILPKDSSTFEGWRNDVGTFEREPERTGELVRHAISALDKHPHATRLILSDIQAIIDGRI